MIQQLVPTSLLPVFRLRDREIKATNKMRLSRPILRVAMLDWKLRTYQESLVK
jgi:hypothetical protein